MDGTASVNRRDLIYVLTIENIKSIEGQFQLRTLRKVESPGQPQVKGVEPVASIRIAWGPSHSVGHRIGIPVYIVPNKDRKWTGRLQIDDAVNSKLRSRAVAFAGVGAVRLAMKR